MNEEFTALLKRIEENDPALTSVNLRGKNIRAEGVIALANALKKNTTLTSFDLSLNDMIMTEEIANAILNLFKINTTLTSFEAPDNGLGTLPIKAINDALKDNERIAREKLSEEQKLALAMAYHPRLGIDSLFKVLDTDLLINILKLAEPSKSPKVEKILDILTQFPPRAPNR